MVAGEPVELHVRVEDEDPVVSTKQLGMLGVAVEKDRFSLMMLHNVVCGDLGTMYRAISVSSISCIVLALLIGCSTFVT